MAEWCDIAPGSCIPFWPTSTGPTKQVVASIHGTRLETQPFDITETHSTFLQLYHEVFLHCLHVCLVLQSGSATFKLKLVGGQLRHCLWGRGTGAGNCSPLLNFGLSKIVRKSCPKIIVQECGIWD